jgi:pyruvate dehydrogenase E2 component (dihydrolipoyllysine-residue acetyltransferase)
MSGGCFTVAYLGGIAGCGFAPITNAAEVAVLSAGKADTEPRWHGDGFAPRLIQPLSLSWDPRAVDNNSAVRFLAQMVGFRSGVRRISL